MLLQIRSSSGIPYASNVPYNGTTPSGGNPLTHNLNVFYEAGDIAWMITSTALVLLMIPGVGLFYSGLARRKSALSLLWLSMMATAVVSFQWFFWGYSLVFSHNAGSFIGTLDKVGFRNVLAQPSVGSARIPDLMFAVYQGMFAAVTVAFAVGAVFERGRMLPCIIFTFIWTTLVYDPIACWTWNPHGWVYKLGGLDFAGGMPVHISAGTAALAYSHFLGKRSGYGTQKLNYRPHNVTHVVIGTVFLWVGWYGLNAGSALSTNLRAIMAAVVTTLSASVGGITWCVVDYRFEKKWSAVGFCSGVISGLVAITPGSGFVPAWAAVIFGICAGILCNFATKIKYWISADDALDIFAVHAVGGVVGNICTGIFAADYIAHLDGYTEIPGGWINGNWIQVAIQLADSASGMGYCFIVTSLILVCMSFIVRYIPAFRLRVDMEQEGLGIDEVEMGELAHDYVELVRKLKPAGLRDDDEFAVSSTPNDAHSGTAHVHLDKDGRGYPLQAIRRSDADQLPYGGRYGNVYGVSMGRAS